MSSQLTLLSSSTLADSGDEDTGDAGHGTVIETERDEFGTVNSVPPDPPFVDEKLERWMNSWFGKGDRCLIIILACIMTIILYGLSNSVIYRVMVLIVAPAMITAELIIFVFGHSHFGLCTFCVYQYAVFFRLITFMFAIGHIRLESSYFLTVVMVLELLFVVISKDKDRFFALWVSVFIIDWGAVHVSSFQTSEQKQITKLDQRCCECCSNHCSLLEIVPSCVNVQCDFDQRRNNCCQSVSDCINSVWSVVDDCLLKVPAPVIIFIVSLISLGLLIESEIQSSDSIFIGICSIISALMIICVIGFLGGSGVWSYVHRIALLMKSLFMMAKYRMALRSKLTKGSSSVKFVLWQALSIISALFLSWVTFTLTARFKASLDSDTLFAKLVHSPFVRNKNVLITCVCVQWLLAQCSLFLLLLPLDIYSANAHRSWLKNQYGHTIFYTQLYSLIPAKQLNLSFVEFWDDSHNDPSDRPSLSNALSTVFKCMIVSFALLPLSLYFAVSGIAYHPSDKLLWINLSLPLLKFANLLILKWVTQWSLLTNEQPKTSPIRDPNGFPFLSENTNTRSIVMVLCMVLIFVYVFSAK